MSIEIFSTADVNADGYKVCVYGKGGIGKTVLCSTAPNPIIISCESGLLSLADKNIPYVPIENIGELHEAYEMLLNDDRFDTICLDSISDLAEVYLSELKATSKDARQAYGDLADHVAKMIRMFRDIKGKNVVFTAKRARVRDDDTSVTNYMPSMPGQTLLNSMPYFFDEVFYMDIMEDNEGEKHRVVRTEASYGFEAKDRSGMLNAIEPPDLQYIFDKMSDKKVQEHETQDLKDSPEDEDGESEQETETETETED